RVRVGVHRAVPLGGRAVGRVRRQPREVHGNRRPHRVPILEGLRLEGGAMDSLTRFRAVALTVPFALALWVLMFAAAGFGNGIYVPFVVFYAPLLVVSSIGWLTFLVAWQVARARAVRPRPPMVS